MCDGEEIYGTAQFAGQGRGLGRRGGGRFTSIAWGRGGGRDGNLVAGFSNPELG